MLPNTAFNPTYDDPKYVGYTYDRTAESLGTAAPIKTALDSWYTSNLSTYASYINQTAEYCNDTSGSTSAYGANLRNYVAKTPSFNCPAPISNYGGTYQLPIGTITADEVAYAGGLWGTDNTMYYLNNGTYFWTMSPCYFSSNAYEFYVSSAGSMYLGGYVNSTTPGFRAVIELNSDTMVTGSGTETDPWIVQYD